MAAIICQKCGTTAGPTDRFCRTCGSPIISATAGDENARDGQPDRGEAGLAGSPISPPKKTSNCLIAAASYVLVMLVLGVVIFIALTSQASGKPVISIVLVGTPTSYNTNGRFLSDDRAYREASTRNCIYSPLRITGWLPAHR